MYIDDDRFVFVCAPYYLLVFFLPVSHCSPPLTNIYINNHPLPPTNSDLKTLFDEVVLQKDTLILSEEGATTWGPCYISSFSLSEAAFYRNYTTLLHNPKYDPNKVFFQGFKDPTGDKPDLDLTEAERIAASRHSDFLVPMQLDRVTEPSTSVSF